jgi:hypothetical protein
MDSAALETFIDGSLIQSDRGEEPAHPSLMGYASRWRIAPAFGVQILARGFARRLLCGFPRRFS